MHGFRYHSIAKHCIVLHVKFDGGLSMSVLRNRQLFTKKKEDKTYLTPSLKDHKKAMYFIEIKLEMSISSLTTPETSLVC
jgi:hypothetical protein